MTALNEKQSKELCRKIEQRILKNGYFIFDTDDWDGLHIEYKQFTHGKNYEYADYTEITVTLDGYNVTDKLQVKYNFIKSIYVGRTGDSYRVYYKRENGEKDGGRPYSMNEAAEFIANRFIELVEGKIMDKKLEARVTRLERLLAIKNENMNLDNLAKRIETLLNQHKTYADKIKVYNDCVEVTFDWDYDYGWFAIKPNKNGGFTVEDEYYTENFDTIQQVVDYLVEKDNANAR